VQCAGLRAAGQELAAGPSGHNHSGPAAPPPHTRGSRHGLRTGQASQIHTKHRTQLRYR
jgi:hypothetical protein